MPFSLPPLPPPSRGLTPLTIAGTSLAVLLFIASAWLARIEISGAAAGTQLSDDVHATEFATSALLSTLKDAETGQRGYLLTNDPTYLAPYNTARSRIDSDFASLDQALLETPAGAGQSATLHDLARQKLAELARTIELHRSGQHDAAIALVRTNSGERIMERFRAEIAAMQAGVQAQLQAARANANGPLAWAGIAALAGLAAALLSTITVLQAREHRNVLAAFKRLQDFTAAYRRSEAGRQRAEALSHAIIEAAPGLIYAKDREGRMILANAATLALVGKSWPEVEGRTDREFLDDPAEGEAIMQNDRRIALSGQVEEVEELVGNESGQQRVWLSTKTPMRDAAGNITGLVGVSVEITERKRIEERQRALLNELNHRVKNTLAVVQAIAMQTLRGADPAIGRALELRLAALASAHDTLTREHWEGANLIDVVNGVLAPHIGVPIVAGQGTPRRGMLPKPGIQGVHAPDTCTQDARFQVHGPPVRLAPRAALALAMGLHELATNALKYGALSTKSGHVEITWCIQPGPTPHLHFIWTERGGPTVMPPTTRGFGSRLIEGSLAHDLHGTATIRFMPTGIVCEITAPLEDVAAPAEIMPFPRVGTIGT